MGGLPEVVLDNHTGFVIPGGNMECTIEKISRLILDGNLRRKMGVDAKFFVKKQYSSEICVGKMLSIYKEMVV